MKIESVAVFCGSRTGKNPIYAQHAKELGKLIAVLGLKLVYGGGSNGLMGMVADEVIKHNGHVIGVIPKMLVELEVQHLNLTELSIMPDMHSRKKMIYDLCDAGIALPGGFGTLDEVFEMLTWNQLKIHDKKIYFLNSAGFYNYLIHHLELLDKEGFLYDNLDERIVFCKTPKEIFNKIE